MTIPLNETAFRKEIICHLCDDRICGVLSNICSVFTLFLLPISIPIYSLSYFPFITCYVLFLQSSSHNIHFTFFSPSSSLIFGNGPTPQFPLSPISYNGLLSQQLQDVTSNCNLRIGSSMPKERLAT